MCNLTQQIKNKARELGMDLVGIAGTGRFFDAPEGKCPEDILPGAKSVIVIGVRILDGAIQAIFRAREEGKKNIHGLFGTYGCQLIPNMHMGSATLRLSYYVQELTGCMTVPTTSGPFQTSSAFSQRRAAVAAGLGEYGWHGYVLTPEFGPRVRFCSIITTAELDEDPLYSGERLCDPSKCQICTKICPTNALPEYSEAAIAELSVAGKKVDSCGNLDVNRCKLACYGFVDTINTTYNPKSQDHSAGYTANFDHSSKYSKALSEAKLELDKNHMSDEDFNKILQNTPPTISGVQSYPNWKCSFCLAYCPAGNWKERFSDKTLSGYSADSNT